METVANFIHGECVTGSGQRVQAIFNPATGEQIRQVVMSTAQETEQAIAAAQQAFPAWARHAPLKRARVMRWWNLPAAFRICKRVNTRRTSARAWTATR